MDILFCQRISDWQKCGQNKVKLVDKTGNNVLPFFKIFIKLIMSVWKFKKFWWFTKNFCRPNVSEARIFGKHALGNQGKSSGHGEHSMTPPPIRGGLDSMPPPEGVQILWSPYSSVAPLVIFNVVCYHQQVCNTFPVSLIRTFLIARKK